MSVSTSLRAAQRQAALEIAQLNATVWHTLYTMHVRVEPCCDNGNLCRFGQTLNDAADAEGRRVQVLEGWAE